MKPQWLGRSPDLRIEPHRSRWIMSLALSLLLWPVGGMAQGPDTAPASMNRAQVSLSTRQDSRVDHVHRHISRGLLLTAEWLDSFFDDERYEREVNKTRLRLSLGSRLIEGRGMAFETNTRLRIVLPELENRLSIELSSDAGRDRRDRPTRTTGVRGVEDGTEEHAGILTAGIRTLVQRTDQMNLDLSSGLQLRRLRPVFFVEPRHRLTWDLADWQLRVIQRVRWSSDETWVLRSQTDSERLVPWGIFFRSTARVEWFEREEALFYDLDFGLSTAWTAHSAVALQWNNRFKTQPQHALETSLLRFRYRHRIWREWPSLEAGPQLVFPDDRDYRPTAGVFLKLNVVFGYTGS